MSKIKKELIVSISAETSLSRGIVEKVLKAYEKKALKNVKAANKVYDVETAIVNLGKIKMPDLSVQKDITKFVNAKKGRIGIFSKEMQKAAADIKIADRKPIRKPSDEDIGPGFTSKRRGRR